MNEQVSYSGNKTISGTDVDFSVSECCCVHLHAQTNLMSVWIVAVLL